MSKRTWSVWAEPIRVIDGDTIVCDLDLGWGTWRRDVHIRLLGVNCPEMPTPAGLAARDATAAWITATRSVRLESHSVDHFGRVLALISNAAGTDLSQYLLDGGFAVPMAATTHEGD